MENFNSFALRHIGLSQADIENLLDQLGYKDLEEFSKSVLPENIFIEQKLELNDAMSEEDALKAIKEISKENSVYRSFIGQGYYGTVMPKVILGMFLKTQVGPPPIPPIKQKSHKAA